MTVPTGYGIDVSHFQDPASLPWESFRGHVDFVIARASYGTHLDDHAKDHIRCAREIDAKVGLYVYFRHDQPWQDQAAALHSVADSVKLTGGDIVPAIDIEDDEIGHVPVAPAWAAPCEALVEQAVRDFGDCLVYVTARGWTMLGRPEWVLHRPLWVAHYRVGKPASPGGMPPTIWQHRVDVWEPNGPSTAPVPAPPGAIDQNRLLAPLPLVGYRPTSDDQARVAALVAETLRSGVQDHDTEPPDTDPMPPPDVEGHAV